MNCSFGDAIQQTLSLSDHLGGSNVYLIYNETHGKSNDLKESWVNLTGKWTDPTHRLHSFWTQYLEKKPNDTIMHTCYSQGTLHTRNALTGLEKAQSDRLFIAALGYVIPISNKNCGDSTNIASSHDYVSLGYRMWAEYYAAIMARDGGRAAKRMGAPMTLDVGTVIKPAPNVPLLDHAFNSPTYQGAINKRVSSFFTDHGAELCE